MAVTQIKRYELLEEVGRGGMAVVYRARDTALDRDVAVKVLHPHLASRPESARRFQREAKAVARLRHRNIVEIFDTSGEEDEADQQFIVTEFVSGGTLRDAVESHPIPFPCIGIALSVELCKALEHAHAHSIIHRDIKPENAMVTGDGVIKLMDFGIAQVLDADRMTASGSLLGSPAHMPPEIIDGKPADQRGDVFSLGTVLYYLCCNQLPFEGTSPTAVLRNIIEGRYPEPEVANPGVGRRLAGIIRRCLELEPEDRYPDIVALKDALEAELEAVGVEESAELARAYLADPEAFTESFRPTLVERMLERADAAVEGRQVAAATDWLNQILSLDPTNERAEALLDRLGRSQFRRHVLIGLVAAIVLGGAVWAAIAYWPEPASDGEAVAAEGTGAETTAAPAEASGQNPEADSETIDPAAFGALGARVGVETQARIAALTEGLLRAADARIARGVMVRQGRSAAIAAVAGAVKRRPRGRVAVRLTQRDKAREKPDPDDAVEAAPDTTDPVAEPEPPPTATYVVKSVYPNDTVARFDGRDYERDDDGSIRIPVPVGHHTVEFSCPKRCKRDTRSFDVTLQQVNQPDYVLRADGLALRWADGVAVVAPSPEHSEGHYYVAFWKDPDTDEDTTKYFFGRDELVFDHDDFGGFGPTVEEIEVTIYAMDKEQSLSSFSENALEDAKVDSKTVTIGPGDRPRIRF